MIPILSHVPSRLIRLTIFGCVLGWWGMTTSVDAFQSSDPKTQERWDRESDPLGVFGLDTENSRVYRHFLRAGIRQVEEQTTEQWQGLSVETIQNEIVRNDGRTRTSLPDTSQWQKAESPREKYRQMVRSSLLFGNIYDCGRCDNLHANIAGGVIISPDGLALTNYHVLEREESGVETIMAMTSQGKAHPVVEILATNEQADVALIRLGGEGPFPYSPLASESPYPMDPVRVISHPRNEYYVMTAGEVSRYATFRSRRRPATQWMEITAPFGGGSSGSAIFNENGEVVGLVSRIHPLFRVQRSNQPRDEDGEEDSANQESSSRYVEMVLRRCVPLAAIRSCFTNTPDQSSQP